MKPLLGVASVGFEGGGGREQKGARGGGGDCREREKVKGCRGLSEEKENRVEEREIGVC